MREIPVPFSQGITIQALPLRAIVTVVRLMRRAISVPPSDAGVLRRAGSRTTEQGEPLWN